MLRTILEPIYTKKGEGVGMASLKLESLIVLILSPERLQIRERIKLTWPPTRFQVSIRFEIPFRKFQVIAHEATYFKPLATYSQAYT